MVRAEQSQRFVKQLGAAVLRPVFFLASEEDLLAVRLESRTQAGLGIPIRRGHVEVVDSPVYRLRHDIAGKRRTGVHDHDAAEAQNGKLLTGLAQLALGNKL